MNLSTCCMRSGWIDERSTSLILTPPLPDKPSFLVREVPQYFPYGVSLKTVYRWIEAGELDVRGPKYFQRVTRESLLKKICQF